jgi:site-specific recombinase XerD
MIDDILAKFDGAFAKNTIRAYRSDFIQYETWCSHSNIDSIPATADAMAQYVSTTFPPQEKAQLSAEE